MDMQEIIEIAETVLRRRIVMANKQGKYDAAHLFIEIQEGLVVTVACTPDNMEALWEKYRENDYWISMVMDASSEWRFRAGLDNDAWENLISLMSESLTVVHNETLVSDKVIVDKAITDRLISQPAIMNLLRANQWFAFVVIMSWCRAIVKINGDLIGRQQDGNEIVEEVDADGKS